MPRKFVWVSILSWAWLVLASSLTVQGANFSFQPLGGFPPLNPQSDAYAVSADGAVAVGRGYAIGGSVAFRYTRDGGMANLGLMPGVGSVSFGTGVSANGNVVVGFGSGYAGFQAFRWTSAGGMVGLGDVPGVPEGSYNSFANGVSADGNVVVGYGTGSAGAQAFRWTASSGMTGLGVLPGETRSQATGVSADGSVVVGDSASGSKSNPASQESFRWTAATGMTSLGFFPDERYDQSHATAVSADGSVVVGYATNTFSHTDQAYLWTSSGGMQALGSLAPLNGNWSRAYGISPDGQVVVGESRDARGGSAPFLWTAATGMVNLQLYLVAGGATGLQGWHLFGITGISADHHTIVGSGLNPHGDIEAFIATVPEPSSLSLAALACVASLGSIRLRRFFAASG